MSAPHNAEKRAAIRETWLSSHHRLDPTQNLLFTPFFSFFYLFPSFFPLLLPFFLISSFFLFSHFSNFCLLHPCYCVSSKYIDYTSVSDPFHFDADPRIRFRDNGSGSGSGSGPKIEQIFGTRIQINASRSGSGSGPMIRIRPDPDPKHWIIQYT